MEDKGSAIYQLFLLILSVYVLCALVLEAFFIDDSEIRLVLQYVDFGICSVFLADFFVNFFTADSKKAYLKWGWIDLLSSIPAVDPLRWGRVSRIVRIIRYLRALRSVRVLLSNLNASRFETLSISVFLVVFLCFTLSSAFILEFERGLDSTLNSAQSALWWSFLNLMNAKASISQAVSPEGIVMTTILNKVGLLIFAYLNAMIIAWLLQKSGRADNTRQLP